MTSDAMKRASKKYNSMNTVCVGFRFSKKNDADILERLDREENKQAYIKRLIRQDIKGGA